MPSGRDSFRRNRVAPTLQFYHHGQLHRIQRINAWRNRSDTHSAPRAPGLAKSPPAPRKKGRNIGPSFFRIFTTSLLHYFFTSLFTTPSLSSPAVAPPP